MKENKDSRIPNPFSQEYQNFKQMLSGQGVKEEFSKKFIAPFKLDSLANYNATKGFSKKNTAKVNFLKNTIRGRYQKSYMKNKISQLTGADTTITAQKTTIKWGKIAHDFINPIRIATTIVKGIKSQVFRAEVAVGNKLNKLSKEKEERSAKGKFALNSKRLGLGVVKSIGLVVRHALTIPEVALETGSYAVDFAQKTVKHALVNTIKVATFSAVRANEAVAPAVFKVIDKQYANKITKQYIQEVRDQEQKFYSKLDIKDTKLLQLIKTKLSKHVEKNSTGKTSQTPNHKITNKSAEKTR